MHMEKGENLDEETLFLVTSLHALLKCSHCNNLFKVIYHYSPRRTSMDGRALLNAAAAFTNEI